MEPKKKCCKCQCEKPFEDFNKSRRGSLGLHNHCRDCQKIVKREWYLANRESELEKNKEYGKSDKAKENRKIDWEKNKDILGPAQNIRRQQEPAKVKARIQRKKWLEIPQNRIAQNLRGRSRDALKSYEGERTERIASTELLLGCSYEEFQKHLESQFTGEMSWETYGVKGWHIDHIIPCDAFDLTREDHQRECFHYTNMRPLWWDENQSKGNRIIIITDPS